MSVFNDMIKINCQLQQIVVRHILWHQVSQFPQTVPGINIVGKQHYPPVILRTREATEDLLDMSKLEFSSIIIPALSLPTGEGFY